MGGGCPSALKTAFLDPLVNATNAHIMLMHLAPTYMMLAIPFNVLSAVS